MDDVVGIIFSYHVTKLLKSLLLDNVSDFI